MSRRGLVQQCSDAGVAKFVKQLGKRPQDEDGLSLKLIDRTGSDPSEWPADLQVREFPAHLEREP